MSQPPTETPPEHVEEPHGNLRGSFVAVVLMAGFFVACWVGVLAIALERR